MIYDLVVLSGILVISLMKSRYRANDWWESMKYFMPFMLDRYDEFILI